MALSKSHSLSSAKQRKPKPSKFKTDNEKYAAVEGTIAKVYVDICNSVSKSDILEKIVNGMYDNKPCIKRHAYEYYNAALSRLQEDADEKQENLKNIFYARYETLLADAIAASDRNAARSILDSMVKLMGLDKQSPSTAIQINSDKDNGVVINFGLNDS